MYIYMYIYIYIYIYMFIYLFMYICISFVQEACNGDDFRGRHQSKVYKCVI